MRTTIAGGLALGGSNYPGRETRRRRRCVPQQRFGDRHGHQYRVATVPVGRLFGVAVTADGKRAYDTTGDGNPNAVRVIATASNIVVPTVNNGGG